MQKLDYLIDFIQNENVENTLIFKELNAEKEEAELLRYITKEYLDGNIELSVYDLLVGYYKKDNYNYVLNIEKIKNLLLLDWININSFLTIKPSELSKLELLHQSISLSQTFLKLLENGSVDLILSEIKPYADNVEYLQDLFIKIDLHKKFSTIKDSKNSPSFKRVNTQLAKIETQIAKRLEVTKETPKIERLFRDFHLNNEEQLIFIALLKEEYTNSDEGFREINSLIDLISVDDYDKLKNRALFKDSAPLLANNLIDYDEIQLPLGGITRIYFIDDEILKDVIHTKKQKTEKVELNSIIKEQEIFELLKPKTTLDDVVLHPSTKEMLNSVMHQMDKTVSARLKEWGIKTKKGSIDAKIIFYGHPGTGKTLTALSIAKTLKKEVISFDCSKILSMYVGESEKNVRKIFDSYKEIVEKTKSEPILLLNEADQFLSGRTSGSTSGAEKMHNQMQNIFLEQIERFEGILIATTNLLENIDPAFSRRFDYKIKFEKPNDSQRIEIWKKLLPKNLPLAEDFSLEELAKYPLTGGQIFVVIKNTASQVAGEKEPIFTNEKFKQLIQKELSSAFGDEKQMGFIS